MALNEDQQTEALFKSSRTGVDPVSGNEVPPGSLPEEVRDDIPAMLSEGEDVVPADVLRYYGMKFFEDLRAQAKMGLAEMESNGRIGGEPIGEETGDVGISDEDLMVIMAQAPQEEPQQVMANQGGLMGFQAGGLNYPAYIKQPDPTQFGASGPDMTGGLEYREYSNEAGIKITIPFFNGQPMAMIPEGYTPSAGKTTIQPETQLRQDDDEGAPPISERTPAEDTFDLDAIPTEELAKTARGMATINNIATGIAATAGLPVAAFVTTSGIARYNDVLDRLKAEDPIAFEKSGLERRGSIFGGESSLTEGLNDINDDGKVDFGDTWMGDALGFDGKAGVQGPSLKDSWDGARRGAPSSATGVKGSSSDKSSDTAPSSGKYSGVKDALEAAGYSVSKDGNSVYSGTGQVAGENWSGSSTVDAIAAEGGNSSSGNSSSGNSSSGNSSGGNSSGGSGTNDGEVGEATGGQGDQGKGSGKGGMNTGGMMQKPKKNKKK